MKLYTDVVANQASRMFNLYMGGYMNYYLDNSMIAYIYEMNQQRVDKDVQLAFNTKCSEYYKKIKETYK